MSHSNVNSHNFTSIDVITLVCGLSLITILFFNSALILKMPSQEGMIKKEALILGYQLWDIELKTQTLIKPSERGLASVSENEVKKGIIGSDLWGRPFHFKIEKTKDVMEISVWSLGPNSTDESEETLPRFASDDLGQTLSIKMKQ